MTAESKVGFRRRARAARLGAVLAMTALTGCAGGHPFGAGFSDRSSFESPLGSYLAGRHARIERDTKAAADFFSAALAEDPENLTLQHRTFLLLLAEGKVERALEFAPALAQNQNTASMASLVLAVDDIRARRYESAVNQLGTPPKRGFGALLKPLMLAWSHAGQGQIEDADRALNLMVERDAFDGFRNFHRALIHDYLGDNEDARGAYEATRKTGGVTTSIALAYGSFLSRGGNKDAAAAFFREILARAPENPMLLKALEIVEDGGALAPVVRDVGDGVAEALYGAAGALTRERGGDAARIYVHLALYLRQDLDAAWMLLGEILERDRRWDDAITVYERMPKASPYYWESRIRVATSLNRLERVDEAIDSLTEMSNKRPDDTTAIVTLADLLRARERYTDAARAYDRALLRLDQPQQRHWALFYARGITRERNKEWQRAEADFLKALELRPDHPLVLNYLGYSWVEQGRHMERARKMIEKAVAQRPNDGYIIDSLGWVYYRMKDYENAVKHLEQAVELKPQDPVINDHLGDAYWQVGRRIEARFQWRHALGLSPDEAEIPKIESKLEKGLANLAQAGSG